MQQSEIDEILSERSGGTAILTLNRPKALNALSRAMCRRLAAELASCEADPAVRAVLVRGAGGRAFCAGGDVRAIYEAEQAGGAQELGSAFFRDEYHLNRRIHRFPKPYVALLDGITMGGGAGLSVHGAYRIATEKLVFAMPETALGLFPDIGANAFFNRCPGQLGLYLGLTGARIGAADALYCGLATHFVPSDRLAALTEAIAALAWDERRERAQIEALLAEFSAAPGPAPLAALRPAIDRCFAHETVEDIIAALDAEGGDWAASARASLEAASPTSLRITLRQLRSGVGISVEEALRLDYRLALRILDHGDFFEGVRAVLVDKDMAPRWRPGRLAEVADSDIDVYFQPLGAAELSFG